MARPNTKFVIICLVALTLLASAFQVTAKEPGKIQDEGDCVECRLRQLERGTLPLTEKDSNANDLDQTARRIERSIQSVRTIHDQKANQNNTPVNSAARSNGRHPAIIEEM